MIAADRLYWLNRDFTAEPGEVGSFYAALFHDIAAVFIIIGIFVEGFRLCQMPLIAAFGIT